MTINSNHDTTKKGAHANESFRFAQLSDPHLSDLKNVSAGALFNKRILGYLSWLKKRRKTHQRDIAELAVAQLKQQQIDHYVITGDLTHIGLENEFKQVADWLSQISKPTDVTIIPGNHDLYVNTHWEHSFHHWQPYMLGDDMPQPNEALEQDALSTLNNIYPHVRIRGPVAFISVSSVFDAPWFKATGKIASAQINKLKTLLKRPELNKLCKVLLIHHPVSKNHVKARKELINQEELLQVLVDTPVELILHGHAHIRFHDRLQIDNENSIPVVGAASCSSISQAQPYRAQYLIFEVQQQDNQWHLSYQDYAYDRQQGLFVNGNRTTL